MSESDSRSSDNEVEEYDGSVNSGDEGTSRTGDGMADMMAKILHQQVHGKVYYAKSKFKTSQRQCDCRFLCLLREKLQL